MTNGTSQGLYVIIAVVIFGIFVGISYLLFNDSLSPKLSTIFEDATDTSQKTLKRNLVFTSSISYRYDTSSSQYDIDVHKNNKITVSEGKTKDWFSGIQIKGKPFKKGNWYSLSYKVNVLEGFLTTLAGHINNEKSIGSDYTRLSRKFYINGKHIPSSYYTNATLSQMGIPQSNVYTVYLEFLVENDSLIGGSSSEGIWIQPNRMLSTGIYKLEITDLEIYQL